MKIKPLVLAVFLLFLCVLLNLNLHHHETYALLLSQKTEKIVEGDTALRGRILDRNGNVLVDNEGVLNIIYRKSPNRTSEKELSIATQLSPYLSEVTVSDVMKKEYFLLLHEDGKNLITEEEYQDYEERKLSKEDLEQIKFERIRQEDITYSKEEEKVIYLYSLMNEGYYYQDKYLFKEISEEASISIMALHLEGISLKVTSKRVYPYGESLKDIFGSIGSIPKEEVKTYVEQGYSLEDRVGVSGLEKTYESILKGTKAKYLLKDDYSLELYEEEQQGQDLVLNLDIDLQLMLEQSLKSELVKARKKKQSIYFHDAYSIIGEPKTGSILAMAGVRLSDDGNFYDITATSLSSSFAMGSVVKGASSTVGYQTGSIDVGKKILDRCVKLEFQPSKCSYKRLGYVDDITALKTSSNYFQFVTAIRSTGQTYRYNMNFAVTKDDFLRYRTTFADYGLGVKTGIDLPNEQIGMIGSKISGDLLLNLSIGQYDTYTPVELFQYINTIANRGKRFELHLAKKEAQLLNEVNLASEYYDRILEGFYQVFHGGTATSYAKSNLGVSGKTGTSETFYDSNQDGVVDTKTINSTVAFFYPRTEPKYSMVVIAPNITNSSYYTYPFTKNISLQMTNYMTEHGF